MTRRTVWQAEPVRRDRDGGRGRAAALQALQVHVRERDRDVRTLQEARLLLHGVYVQHSTVKHAIACPVLYYL